MTKPGVYRFSNYAKQLSQHEANGTARIPSSMYLHNSHRRCSEEKKKKIERKKFPFISRRGRMIESYQMLTDTSGACHSYKETVKLV